MKIKILVFIAMLFCAPAFPADFDGDGTDDVFYFNRDTGYWAIRGITQVYYGTAGDLAAPFDYNGDGTDEIAIYRPITGLWAARGVTRIYWGTQPSKKTLYGENGNWDISIYENYPETFLVIYPDTEIASEVIVGANSLNPTKYADVAVLMGDSKVELKSYNHTNARWESLRFSRGTSFYPSTGGVDLGQIGDRWKNLRISGVAYIGNRVVINNGLVVGGTISLSNALEITGNVISPPDEGKMMIGISPGLDESPQGDLVVAETRNGTTRYKVIFSFGEGTLWQ